MLASPWCRAGAGSGIRDADGGGGDGAGPPYWLRLPKGVPMANQLPDHVPGTVPDLLPVLAKGKHRSPAEGGCFMEFASWMAGERWSDHPSCTHPLLASLARLVNDAVTDYHRPQLAPLVPAVVGLAHDDLHVDALVARRCALIALPHARPEDRRVLAVALLTADRVLADLDARPEGLVSEEVEQTLAVTPAAADWAREMAVGRLPSARAFRRHAGPTAVRCAVNAILHGTCGQRDLALHGMLAAAIDDVVAWLEPPAAAVDADRWSEGCHLLDPVPV